MNTILATPTNPMTTQLAVPLGRKRSIELRIDDVGLRIGDRSASFDEIRAVAYATKPVRANLVQRRVWRRIWMSSATDLLHLDLGGGGFGATLDAPHALAHGSVLAALHDHVEPRLRRELVDEIVRTGATTVGTLLLSRTGITALGGRGRKERPWHAVPVAELNGDAVLLSDGRNDAKPWAAIDACAPNVVLLPELLMSCVGAFG